MKLVRTVDALRTVLDAKRSGATVGLVPTMGALHRGHVALFAVARRESDVVVATIFVNPAQFSEPSDLDRYPRQEAADAALAERAGVDVLFVPPVAEVYPPGFATWIDVEGAAEGFEGEYRPGHFRGVATVCAKLFGMVGPDVAYFGQKDAQQVAVLRQLVRDLNLRLRIRVVPTVRESDGLALSSRNVHLSPEDRRRAAAIPRALRAGLKARRDGEDPVEATRRALEGLHAEYVGIAQFEGHPTLVVAVRLGTTRLIDNTPLDAPFESLDGAVTPGAVVPAAEVTHG